MDMLDEKSTKTTERDGHGSLLEIDEGDGGHGEENEAFTEGGRKTWLDVRNGGK